MAGKLQKSNKKKEQVKKIKLTGDWLYFCPQEITIRKLYEVFTDKAELWEDAGVIEISMNETGLFDIESTEIHPKDEIILQFADEQGAKCVFLATFAPDEYENAQVVMQQILEKFGGVFCADTEDFQPQYR